MTDSPNLGFDLILANQSSKHVTVNTALLALEAIAAGVVLGIVNDAPPSPADGDLYIVSATPSGSFTGQANKFAYFYGTTWVFYNARPNQRLYNSALSSYVAYNGTTWASISLGGSSSPTTTKGDLIVRDAATDIRQPVGTDGQVLTADSSLASGVKWAPISSSSPTTTEGDLIVRGATVDTRLGVGTNNQVLTVDTAVPGGIKWTTPASGFSSPTTTKGDLIVRNATADIRQPVGTDGQVLTADSSLASGVKWETPTASGGLSALNTGSFATITYPSNRNFTGNSSPSVFNDDLTAVATGGAGFVLTTAASGFSVNTAGTYLFHGAVTLNSPPSNRVHVVVATGSSPVFFLASIVTSAAAIVTLPIPSFVLTVAANVNIAMYFILTGTSGIMTIQADGGFTAGVYPAVSKLFVKKIG